ncbi:MAG: YrhB domain-containing protein [Pirellulales bacterium]
MTREEAQRKAEEYLASQESDLGLVILENATLEFSYGWVFFYQTRKFVKTGWENDPIAGNAPILIDRRDGSLHVTGTAQNTEYYIQNFEDTGNPHLEAVPAVVISGWREDAQKVEAIRTIRRLTHLGLAKSKSCIDNALEGTPTTIQMDDFDQAHELQSSLVALGWNVTVVRQSPGNSQANLHS